jgi:hypothetical protein
MLTALAIFCFSGCTFSVHAAVKLTADIVVAVLCHQIVCDDVLLLLGTGSTFHFWCIGNA